MALKSPTPRSVSATLRYAGYTRCPRTGFWSEGFDVRLTDDGSLLVYYQAWDADSRARKLAAMSEVLSRKGWRVTQARPDDLIVTARSEGEQ